MMKYILIKHDIHKYKFIQNLERSKVIGSKEFYKQSMKDNFLYSSNGIYKADHDNLVKCEITMQLHEILEDNIVVASERIQKKENLINYIPRDVIHVQRITDVYEMFNVDIHIINEIYTSDLLNFSRNSEVRLFCGIQNDNTDEIDNINDLIDKVLK